MEVGANNSHEFFKSSAENEPRGLLPTSEGLVLIKDYLLRTSALFSGTLLVYSPKHILRCN